MGLDLFSMSSTRSNRPEILSFKKEFNIRNFGLHYDNPAVFVSTQCGPRHLYIPWTFIWAVFHVIVILLQPYFLWTAGKLPTSKWFFYLTNWGYTSLVIFSLCDCLTTLYVHIKRRDILNGTFTGMPWYIRVVWVFFSVASVSEIYITFAYFLLLDPDYDADSILTHLISTVFVVLNCFISAKPVRVLHFYLPIIFSFLYMIVSIIHQFSGSDPVYPLLDWYKPSAAIPIFIVSTLILSPLVHLLLYGMYRLRMFVHSRLCFKDVVTDPLNPSEEEIPY